ncbi:MAG: site-2 protease family protein [bacterium]
MDSINYTDMLIWYVAFLFSATAHEASHALAALKGGDITAYQGGQVTLNPIPHIKRSPVGTVVVPLISYFLGGWMIGWASAPYDPTWAERHPRRAAWMAAAGPTANFLIAILAFIFIKIGLATGVFEAPDFDKITLSSMVVAEVGIWIVLAKLLSIFLMLNLILFIFNLFPFPPLDGSSVITLFMSEEMALQFRKFMSHPAFSFLGIVLAWRFFVLVFREVFILVFKLIHSGTNF